MERLSRGKRIVFTALTGILALLLVEFVSWLAFTAMDSEPFSFQGLSAERQLVMDKGDVDENAFESFERASRGIEGEVVHPFLGFVHSPDDQETHRLMERFQVGISEYGFFVPSQFSETPSPEAYRVGIFGGSVAMALSNYGDLLVSVLKQSPTLADQEIVVINFAMGGYKQPQQLMVLSYFLSLGERLDMVINLDGFNEVALPFVENVPNGVFPFYPRAWRIRAGHLPDLPAQRCAGRIDHLYEKRADHAKRFEAWPWRRSVTCNLFWKGLDRRLAVTQQAMREEMVERLSGERSFFLNGPAYSYDSEEELFHDLAAMWMRGSVQMHRLCQGNGIAYYHFLQPNQYVPDSKPMGREERTASYCEDHKYREPKKRDIRTSWLAEKGSYGRECLSGIFPWSLLKCPRRYTKIPAAISTDWDIASSWTPWPI